MKENTTQFLKQKHLLHFLKIIAQAHLRVIDSTNVVIIKYFIQWGEQIIKIFSTWKSV